MRAVSSNSPRTLARASRCARFVRWTTPAMDAAGSLARRTLQTLLLLGALTAWLTPNVAQARVEFTPPPLSEPIFVRGERAMKVVRGTTSAWVVSGGVVVQQGDVEISATEAVLWNDEGRSDGQATWVIDAAFSGRVELKSGEGRMVAGHHDAELVSLHELRVSAEVVSTETAPAEAQKLQDVYRAALTRRATKATRAQSIRFQTPEEIPQPGPASPPEVIAPRAPVVEDLPSPAAAPAATSPTAGRRLRAFPRSSVALQVESRPGANGQEQITTITNGVELIIDGQGTGGPGGIGSVSIATDRMVIWSEGRLDLSGSSTESRSRGVEIYMEGNIEFREGDRVIYAERMYYNVALEQGVILGAELFTSLPGYNGRVRVKADEIRQIAKDRFQTSGTWFTTSLLSRPTYRWQMGTLTLQDHQSPLVDPASGGAVIDPNSGNPAVRHDVIAQSYNNTLFLQDVPVFYWPYLRANLTDPTLYLKQVRFRNDRVFGTQLFTQWDLLELSGLNLGPNVEANLHVDYLSDRGLGLGANSIYAGDEMFGIQTRYFGMFDAWGIKDDGVDNLGLGRRDLVPEEKWRGRIFQRQRNEFDGGWQLTSELGLISDRNFLEQYYEVEYDTFKDQTSGMELKRLTDNRSLSFWFDSRPNTFLTDTEWWPRINHQVLGQTLLNDHLTWHSSVNGGYGRYRIASTPTDPEDLDNFVYRPYEISSKGERFIAHEELDAPFQLAGVNFVPYVVGQAGHWGQVLDGDDTQRLYGQAGLRTSLPFWAAFPEVDSQLFNVHGLAHKVTLRSDAFIAGANRPVTDFPLYDAIDDNSQEAFRRRFEQFTFGGVTPIQFDERYYAVRENLAGNVTTPSGEILDDLTEVKMALQQRWQTKRGPVGDRHIIDWMTLDVEATYFPNANRDNFGADFGMVNYEYQWHVGDRLTLMSDGFFDFFDQGQKVVSVGAQLTRPTNGSLQVGFKWLEGPIQSNVVILGYDYRLSQKWATNFFTNIDVTHGGAASHRFSLTRIGESFLFQIGANYNSSRNNFGGFLMLEPRFLSGRLGTIAGQAIGVDAGGSLIE